MTGPALKIFLSLFLTALAVSPAPSQDNLQRYGDIDILEYRFEIHLNDTTDRIEGTADIAVKFTGEVDQFQLDLTGIREDHKGMAVKQISEDGTEIFFQHQDDRITLKIPRALPGTIRNYRIIYSGIPDDGLIISKNKFGDRTFFGDNWPNRGHHWLPMVDHPSDKALVEFLVSAPDHYRVVSVGTLRSEYNEAGIIHSDWKTTVPLSTKLMVIGVSPFAVDRWLSPSGVPVSSWVYPQNKEEGFYDFRIATGPLEFFESYIAPYPYAKLANVQSKTVYGGMENASCIFYSERTVNGKQDHENLFAHEIAHQWFGDGVSELDWHHIWLSEGFATYLTDIYIEQVHGRDAFLESMQDEKRQVLRYARRRLAPIVDTTLPVSIRLLNNNSYEKAAWVLHMLRHDLGDQQFQKCLRTFYEEYKFSNALTEDFREVVETVTGKSYGAFFKQWFYQPGQPRLSMNWTRDGKTIRIDITQHQDQYVFEFPLELEITGKRNNTIRKTLQVSQAIQSYSFNIPFRVLQVRMDPDSWLLYEEN
jgi:aminopeptidase N